jgi:hypothetical protein
MDHSRLKAGAVLLIAVLAVSGWYAFRPERAFIDVAVSEAMPPEALALQSRGQFVPGAHEGAGQAHIYRRADGSHVVRFSGFRTLNGPDVRVYLLGTANVESRKQLADAGFLDLGPLKGNVGDQNYEVPVGTEMTRYVAVAVWCRRFGVNFTTAALVPARPGNRG